MPKTAPSEPLTKFEIDIIDSITAALENSDSGPFIYPEPFFYLPSFAIFIPGTQADTVPSSSWWPLIVAHGEGIEFSRKDVGALFQYGRGNHKSFVTTKYLMNLVNRRSLNTAQLHEVERLLNKAGRTLGMNIPPVPVAKDEDLKEALFEVLRREIESRPKFFYQNFLENLAEKGIPVDMAHSEFKKLVNEELKA